MAVLPYHEDTAALIEKMCQLVEREDYKLDKADAAEAILKTYDIFGLQRPKQVVWGKDLTNKQFIDSAWSARSAGSAWSARSAWSAWSAGSARSAGSAGSAGSAWSAWSAGSARSAGSAGSAGSARSAWSAWSAGSAGSARSARSAGSAGSARFTALDDDFNWFVIEYEYCKNPDNDHLPNEYDQKYLEYSQLLLEAIEAGAGYRVEWEDTLYIIPAPLVKIDEQIRFHSETGPAIRWKGGTEDYLLHGENFDKPLWDKIINKTLTAKEAAAIDDVDKRQIARSMLAPGQMLADLKAEYLMTGARGTKLYVCRNFEDTGDDEYLMTMNDPSSPREFLEFVPREIGMAAVASGEAEYAQAAMYRDKSGASIPLEDYLSIRPENHG